MREQICDVGRGVFVSGLDGCDAARLEFDQVIHIVHASRKPQDTCAAAAADSPHTVEYTDCEPLRPGVIDYVSGVAKLPGKLLVHCAYGQCRGPTLATVALMARGAAASEALHEVTVGIWRRRRIMPHWCPAPMAQIFEWWESEKAAGRL